MTKQEQLLEGLTFAWQNSDPRVQASLLTDGVDYLPQSIKEDVLQTVLTAIKAMPQEGDRLNCL